jgi:ribonuclease D
MQLIDTQEKFNNACKKLLDESIIFVDTEFHRRRTYYAKLSIVQIATNTDRMILDMLAFEDHSALKTVFAKKEILKVFHAPDQDFDIFYNIFGEIPQNVFDTQTAAGVIGMDCVMGYARLCKAMLHIDLDKTMQTANWLTRPLRKELLEYAIKDVDYLIPLYRDLSREIDSRKLWDTYKTRSERLENVETYKFSAERLLKKFTLHGKPPEFRERLVHFLVLREECAIQNDIPRTFCATDGELVQLCEKLPRNGTELSKTGIYGKALVKGAFKKKLLSLCTGMR